MSALNGGSFPGLSPGDHGCCLYRDEAELHQAMAGFVRHGLEAGARLLWLWDRHSPGQIESFLRGHGIETGALLAGSRLQLRSVDDTLVSAGHFRSAEALAFVREEVGRAQDEGYPELRIVLETGALASRLDDPTPLLRFEETMSELVQDLPCSALCLYSLTEVPSRIVLSALDVHSPISVEGRSIPGPGEGAGPPTEDADPDLVLQDRLRGLGLNAEAGAPPARDEPGLLSLLRAVERAAEESTEEEILRSALREICIQTGWAVGHVWIPDEAEEYLSSKGIWHIGEPERFRRLREATEAVRFHRGVGLPGRAWETRRPVRVADLGPERGFLQSRGQQALGIRSAFGVPVRAGTRVLAVMELSSPDPREPDDELLATMDYVGARLGELLERKRLERRLSGYERRFRAIEEASAGAVVVTDGDGTIVSWSAGAASLFGRESNEVVGTSVAQLIPEWHRRVDEAVLEGYLATGEARVEGHRMQLHGVARGGGSFPIEVSLTSWESEGGRFLGNVIRHRSPPEGKEAATQETGEGLPGAAVGWKVREAVVVTTGRDAGGGVNVLYANPAFSEMTGYEESEVPGRALDDLLSGPDTDPEPLSRIREAMEREEAASEEITAYRKDGSAFRMEWSVAPVRDEEGRIRHFVHVQADVGRERNARDAVRRANVDSLTGVADRSVMLQRIQRCIERRQSRPDYQFAVLFLDLDDFKEVNDSLGHIVGDHVLVAVARRLERSVRPGDTVARYGGDEFVILLEFVLGLEDVIAVAERIRSEIALPFTFRGREVAISVSIGVALSETGYLTPVRMLEDADAAMYRAKQEGSAGYRIYDEHLHQEALSVLRLESELLRSVRESAFILHYQPLVALDSGGIIGFEALLRWRHPERGFLSPDHFLSLAEKTGLIVSIGEWVLREACRQVQEWQGTFQTDPPLVLSVNVSGKELADPGFVARLEGILEETGMGAGQLQLEITEGVLTEEREGLEETLRTLRRMGVMTCIDDFGTGYSSLVNVHRFSLGTLKIDRLLVGGLGSSAATDPGGQGEITHAILSLARNLGMRSIAEGVETASQLDRLLELGCEFGQGFFFSAPLDAEGAAALLGGKGKLTGENAGGRPAVQ